MNKKEIIDMSKKYSENEEYQDAYKAGFQAACNIIKQKINTYYNDGFYNEMEKLANVSFMDLDDYE